jgi:putative ABC transport system permease protein
MVQELRYAFRSLLKNPGFTIVAILTLALGIGATTAMLSVVDAVLMRPVPFPDVNRLLMIWETDRASDTSHEPASFPDLVDFKQRSRRVSDFAAFAAGEANLTPERGEPLRVAALSVTNGLFPLLGITPTTGRSFTAAEDLPGGGMPIVISDDLWRRQFGRDPQIVGRTLRLNDRARTIVGVAPSSADFGIRQILNAADYGRGFADGEARGVDVFIPLQADEKRLPRSTHPILVVGRLAQGATTHAAQEELSAIAADLEKTYPENEARGVFVQPIRDVVLGAVEPPLLILLSAVSLVLLIACVNVAHLLLIRGTSRAREIAVKRALGVGSSRLVRQFLTESAVLVGLSTLLGIWLTIAGLRAAVLAAPVGIPRLATATIDLRVLAMTTGVSIAVALIFGLLPLFQLRHANLQSALKADGTRGMTGGRERAFGRSILVAGEIALAVVLVIAAGLLIKSFWRLQRVNPGFEARGVFKAEYQLPGSRYPKSQDAQRFNETLLARVAALPSVESVGIAGEHPLAAGFTNSFSIVGRESEAAEWPEISTRRTTPGYFRTMSVPLVRGRLFTDSDTSTVAPVVLINEETVRRFFPHQDPIGHRMAFWGQQRTIIGIVGNERIHGLRQLPPISVYLPMAQAIAPGGVLLVRTSSSAEHVRSSVAATLREIEPGAAVFGVEPLEGTIARSVGEERFTTQLIGAFGVLALTLAIIGVHSVQSYLVAQRTREIGIRLALGATSDGVTQMVLRQGAKTSAAGLGVGLILALVSTRALSGLLFGVTAVDVETFAVVTLLLGLVALLATWLPARRASRVDPIVALRCE